MATLTPKEVAVEFETDARTLRKFLRSPQGMDARVGKGQRWSIERKSLRSLRKRFDAWNEARSTETTPDEGSSTDEG